MLLVLLCQTCLVARPIDALTPYFEGTVSAERLSIDRPCPTGTELTERTQLTATCVVPDRPSDELLITFDEHDGHLVGYATSVEGYAQGVHRSWYPSGVARERAGWVAGKRDGHHAVQAEDGKTVLDETYLDGIRTGSYATYAGTQLRDHGFYANGLKEGHWEEYVDGRLVDGNYRAGKRIGEWQVRDHGVSSRPADYFVGFEDDRPIHAEESGASYRNLIGTVDCGWLALAIYGHYHDWRLEAVGAVGLAGSAPLIHAWQQRGHSRKVVLDSLAARPQMIVGMFALYSIGKFFKGLNCKGGDDGEGGYDSCARVELDYNTHYNWNALALWSGIAIVSMDLSHAFKRKSVATERAWPQLGVMPVHRGSGVALSGRF